jgi:hypothetical protein
MSRHEEKTIKAQIYICPMSIGGNVVEGGGRVKPMCDLSQLHNKSDQPSAAISTCIPHHLTID